MKATAELVNEHRGIEVMLKVLKAVATRLRAGETVPADHLESILEFLTVFVDHCHHGKEEAFLFPAMEKAGVRRDGGPIGVMLTEHVQGRQLIGRIKDALSRHASGAADGAEDVAATIDQYVDLLTQHIAKENGVLFPLAESRLDAGQDEALFESFEQLERERIGPGRHEAFHALLDQLQATYLQ